MKIGQIAIGFCSGFLVASIIGLTFIVPIYEDVLLMNVGSDYCLPLGGDPQRNRSYRRQGRISADTRAASGSEQEVPSLYAVRADPA